MKTVHVEIGSYADYLGTVESALAVLDNIKPATCCDDPQPYSDLRQDVDEKDGSTGLIVQMGCSNCNTIFGYMHPLTWQDIYEGKDSKELTDVLKRG